MASKKVSKQLSLDTTAPTVGKTAKAKANKQVKAMTVKDLQGIETSPEYLEAVQAEVRAFQKLVDKVLGQLPGEEVAFMDYDRRSKIFAVKTHMRRTLVNFLEAENLKIIASR
jgi:hypothetical protein